MQHFVPSKKSQLAVTVLVHGLNNAPAVLHDLTDFLSRHGSGVVVVALSGHQGDRGMLRHLKKSQWRNDLASAHRMACAHSRTGQPLYFIGYSIGALINLTILSETVTYDRMVLLAPAITLKWTAYLSKPFYSLWEGLPVLSIAPAGYHAHRYLPVHLYKILFEFIALLKGTRFRYCNIPALIVIDPEDETISFKKLRKLARRYGLDQWEMLVLDSKDTVSETKFHHLIINQKAMGRKNWQHFTSQVRKFLSLGPL